MNKSGMMGFVFFLVVSSLLQVSPVMSLWEYAVTTKNKIMFYDQQWTEITSAAHQFDELSAIAFDESQEEIYFNDQNHQTGSIFSLKLSQDNNHVTQRILSRTQNESIAGMAFDPVDRILYWTDSHNRKIYKLSVDEANAKPKILIDFTQEEGNEQPDGIAIDICRRKLYWTNADHNNPSIMRSSLSGLDREILINKTNNPDLYIPHGIVVDQSSHQIFWVDDQFGRHYSIERANFDGTERQVVVKGVHNIPLSLAVTKNKIFWTDVTTNNAVWEVARTSSDDPIPTVVRKYANQPKGLVARIGIFTKLGNIGDCKNYVDKIRNHVLSPKIKLDKEAERKRQDYCMNNGEYNSLSGTCVCKVGYTGSRCETWDCQNHCVHGTCEISDTKGATCSCQNGFYGERCESSRCTNFCLNNGECKINGNNGMPMCECPDSHSGDRCQTNAMEICYLYCKYGRNNTEWSAPLDCPETCDEETFANYRPQKLRETKTESYKMCSDKYNQTWIITIVGVLIALTLTLFIVKSIRRIYKPARPRIKKTFVVQKKISQTPLTSRPVATEQCEITIENCCNMNICDTPCFDPKLLQQNISCDSAKDDKKLLINHMEDDLY